MFDAASGDTFVAFILSSLAGIDRKTKDFSGGSFFLPLKTHWKRGSVQILERQDTRQLVTKKALVLVLFQNTPWPHGRKIKIFIENSSDDFENELENGLVAKGYFWWINKKIGYAIQPMQTYCCLHDEALPRLLDRLLAAEGAWSDVTLFCSNQNNTL